MAAIQCRQLLFSAKRSLGNWQARALSTTSPRFVERSVNSVQLMGRVGANPQTVSGEKDGKEWSFVQFPLATNETRYIQSEDRVENKTLWHNVIAKRPSVVNFIGDYVVKGSRVYISGKLFPRVIEPTEEGEIKRRDVQVNCNELILLTRTVKEGAKDGHEDQTGPYPDSESDV